MKFKWVGRRLYRSRKDSHWDLVDENGRVLAWISERPLYCDRGHYLMLVEAPCGIDNQDGFPRYYMRLKTAKQETEDFLRWRLEKVRADGKENV